MDLVRFIAEALRRWPRASSSPEHLRLGAWGERLAARRLAGSGYKILYRNFRSAHGGEIDIVARDRTDNALVFIEVKTRSTERFGRPIEAVDRKKRRLIIKGAMAWLRMLDMPDLTFRFDVVEIVGSKQRAEVRIIQNAFNLPEPYIY